MCIVLLEHGRWTGSIFFIFIFVVVVVSDAMKRELEQRMREEFAQLSRLKNQDLAPRWSNGWIWQGKPFKRPVYLEVRNKKKKLFYYNLLLS